MDNIGDIVGFLKENKVFYFASVDGNKPRVRPFGFCMEYDGRLYFGMGSQKESYRQTVENPNVEVCSCSPEGRWLRIRGTAVFDPRDEVTRKMYEVSPGLRNMYNDETGLVHANFYIRDGEAEIADMKGNFEKFSF